MASKNQIQPDANIININNINPFAAKEVLESKINLRTKYNIHKFPGFNLSNDCLNSKYRASTIFINSIFAISHISFCLYN